MAYSVTGQVVTAVSTGALAANKLCKIDSNGQFVAASAATDEPIGVSFEAANADYVFPLQINGIARVKLGGTVDEGDWLVSDASGYAVARATMDATPDAVYGVIGRALEAGVSDDIIAVLLMPQPHLVNAIP